MVEPEPQAPTTRKRLRPDNDANFDTVLIVGGLVLFLVLLFAMATPPSLHGLLNPPLIAVAGVILLWPLRKHRTVQALLLAGGFLLVMWFLDRLATILLPFVLVYVLAYLFNPLVAKLRQRFNIPRWASATMVTALALGVVALIILLVVPNIVGELRTLTSRLLGSVGSVREWLTTTPLLDRLAETGLIDKQELNNRLTTLIQDQATQLAQSIPNAIQGFLRSISSLLGLITIIGIFPVILFYTLKDYPFINRRLVELFPTFGGRRDYLVKAGGIVGNYLRGQLTISAIAAFNVSVVLLIFNVPFALLIGLLGGILNMVPNIGIIIANIVGITLAVIFGDPWYLDALIVFLVLLGESLLESSVLTPNILSHHVGLHPVLILLSLFVFGYFMGIFGLLIAVPATAIIMTFYKAYRDNLTFELANVQGSSSRPLFRRPWRRSPTTIETSEPSDAPKGEPEPDPDAPTS